MSVFAACFNSTATHCTSRRPKLNGSGRQAVHIAIGLWPNSRGKVPIHLRAIHYQLRDEVVGAGQYNPVILQIHVACADSVGPAPRANWKHAESFQFAWL